MRKTERTATLNNANISTTKFFSLNLPDGLRPGAKVTLLISEDGNLTFVPEEDEIKHDIIKSGYVNNNRLFRRWVMAHMFKMLDYVSWRDGNTGFDAYVRDHHDYQYQFKMMLNEVHALAAMERAGGADFEVRKSFFTKDVIIEVCEDYLAKLKKYVGERKVCHCKGHPYVKVGGTDIYCSDLEFKLYAPTIKRINHISSVNSYKFIEIALREFIQHMVKLPWETPKSKVWKDTFKGEGAYYTLQNLIRFHNVRAIDKSGRYTAKYTLTDTERVLEQKRIEYAGQGWRLFAFMKKMIEDNDFNFKKRMKEIYGR